jgi:hypothetical protein
VADRAGDGAVGDAFEDLLGDAEGTGLGGGWEEFGDGGEGAVLGVEDQLFGDVGGAGGVVGIVELVVFVPFLRGGCGAGFARQGADGDLEAVEEHAGAFGVEVVGGDAAENLREGELDGGAVLDDVEEEWLFVFIGIAVSVGARGGAVGAVVVVAEEFAAESGGAAAAAGGVEMAAGEALGCGLRVGLGLGGLVGLVAAVHWLPPPRGVLWSESLGNAWVKSKKSRAEARSRFPSGMTKKEARLKCAGPASVSIYCFNCTGWSITSMPTIFREVSVWGRGGWGMFWRWWGG